MKKETHKITDKAESYVNNDDQKTTRFLYRGVASNETFINMWLNMLFNDAQQIFQRQFAYYNSLNLPNYILNKISFDQNNKYIISIKVIGFNSKKFDINILVNHITDNSIHIKSVIGTETQYKSLTLTHNDYPFPIQFLDLKSFLAEGDLDKYATKFARIPEKQKGVFHYEFLDTQNYVSELNKQELFQHQDFKSSLKQKNISESEYNNYKELSKNMSRLDYLEWYNTQDVLIMGPIIGFLINQFHKYDIDMLRNISLSSCADQVKFATAYKDFDINGDYSIQQETTFDLTEEYFKKKD
jgi:hypothetical protein